MMTTKFYLVIKIIESTETLNFKILTVNFKNLAKVGAFLNHFFNLLFHLQLLSQALWSSVCGFNFNLQNLKDNLNGGNSRFYNEDVRVMS